MERTVGKGELPEPPVLRVAVELPPTPFGGRHEHEPSRHQPQDPLIDLIMDGSGREIGPGSGEHLLIGLQVSELGVHECGMRDAGARVRHGLGMRLPPQGGFPSYPSRPADSSGRDQSAAQLLAIAINAS